MDLTKLDDAYKDFEFYMRKQNRFPCPDKMFFKIWEEWKLDNGYEKKPTPKKNATKGF